MFSLRNPLHLNSLCLLLRVRVFDFYLASPVCSPLAPAPSFLWGCFPSKEYQWSLQLTADSLAV